MKEWLSCGQYTVCIEGCRNILSRVNLHWEVSSEEKDSDAVIHIKEGLTESGSGLSDGWEYQKNGVSVYYQNGKALIGLESAVSNNVTVYIRKAFESYIRIGIQYGLMFALCRECISLHGVTVLCGSEVFILSAPSGTGKTTLAKLLEKYCDAVIINGDFALLHLTEKGVIYEPTPFCGSSGRSLNHRFLINRVVFLGQAKGNYWSELDGREAMTRFMSNAFVPEWDSEMTQAVQGNILKCIDAVKVNVYDFAPTQEAAEMFFEQVGGRK